ncbi:MAG: hypothetical protein ACLTYN_10025 [Dysosmobacter welbionis]
MFTPRHPATRPGWKMCGRRRPPGRGVPGEKALADETWVRVKSTDRPDLTQSVPARRLLPAGPLFRGLSMSHRGDHRRRPRSCW